MLAAGLAGRWGLYWRAGVLGRPRPQAVQAPVAHRPGQEVVRREPAGHRTPKLSNPDTPPQSGQGAWRNEGGAHGDADDGGGRLPAHHRSEGAVWGSSGEEEGRALTCRESGWADRSLLQQPAFVRRRHAPSRVLPTAALIKPGVVEWRRWWWERANQLSARPRGPGAGG